MTENIICGKADSPADCVTCAVIFSERPKANAMRSLFLFACQHRPLGAACYVIIRAGTRVACFAFIPWYSFMHDLCLHWPVFAGKLKDDDGGLARLAVDRMRGDRAAKEAKTAIHPL